MEDIILKRLHSKSDEYITIEKGSAYTCGRARTSHIVCSSTVVSRNHCTFLLDAKTKVFSVTDLSSSNGVFVNENRIEAKINFPLNISDIVGIGCCDYTNDKDFIYEVTTPTALKTTKKRKRNGENNTELPAKVSKIVDVIDNSNEDIQPKINNNQIKNKTSKIKTEELVSSTTDLVPRSLNSKNDKQNNINCQKLEEKKNKTIKELTNSINKKKTSNKTIDPPNKNNSINVLASNENTSINKKPKPDDEDLREIINKKKKQKKEAATIASTSNDSVDINFGDISNIPDTSFTSNYETDQFKSLSLKNEKHYSPSPEKEAKSTYSQINFVDINDKYDEKNQEEEEEEEEDFFPCSQLFEDATDFKDKPTEENNADLSHEFPDEFPDESEKNDEVIVLSDDDDDDEDDVAGDSNRWLARIYRSQILNESQVKDEIDEKPVNNVNKLINDSVFDELNDILNDDVFNELDEVEKKSTSVMAEKNKKSLDKKEKNKSSDKSVNKIDDKIEKDKKKNKKKEKEKRKSNELKNKKTEDRTSSSLKKSHDLDKTKTKDQVHLSSNDKNKILSKKSSDDKSLSSLNNISFNKASVFNNSKNVKKIQEIEAPHLLKGGRQSISSSVTTYQTSTENKLLSVKKILPIPKLSSKTKKETIEKEKIEEHRRSIDKKNRTAKYPWANIAGMPSGKPKSSPLTKEQQQERKEKLRKIEEEKKKTNKNDSIEKRIAKPKAKISLKSRGDFLLSEISKSLKKNDNNENGDGNGGGGGDNNDADGDDDVDDDNDNDDDEESKISNEDTSESETSDKLSSIKKLSLNDKKNILLKNPRVELVDCFMATKKQLPQQQKKQDKNKEKDKVKDKNKEVIKQQKQQRQEKQEKEKEKEKEKEEEQKIKNEKENESPNEIKINDNNSVIIKKPKKRVTFNSKNLTTVRIYEIESGNSLKKCVAKDANLPLNIMKVSKENILISPKLEEFLLNIFNWNPLWLGEQKSLPHPPPIVEQNTICPLLTKYSSYDDYYKVMEPLLSLEVWAGITREFDLLDPIKRPSFFASIVTGSISIIPTSPNSNTQLTQLMLELVLSKDEALKRTYPDYGDLIIFEMALNKSNKDSKNPFCNLFAYVNSIHVTVIAPFTKYNKDLAKHVNNPHTLITYTLITRLFDIKNIAINRRHRLRKLCYLRSNMRMVQALQYLPSSPLFHKILEPTCDNYQLPIIDNYENYKLRTNDLLNKKQLEAVVRITESVIQRKPKICMVQGPPGTGKSKVIINILTEILYGNNRYSNGIGPLRILVCAPSNAAIDEIVLRLLEVRKNIHDKKKFNLVRTGRPETMNESVKMISLEELAKRDVNSRTNITNQNLESIEAEKSHLLARINALKMELDVAKKSDNIFHQQTIKERYETTKIKYELLTNKKTSDNINSSHFRKLRRDSENKLLRGADIIACTLSSCYTNKMESLFNDKEKIGVCIVDEATQSTEAETLIPLMLGVNTLVLVGDPNQLPATVLSNQAKKYGLDKSLFSRLNSYFETIKNNPVIFLDTQYRMAYPISYWPNMYFYNGALKNASLQILLPFENYRVINLESIQNQDKYTNSDEATYVSNLIYTMATCDKLYKIDGPLKIGIVTPYNNQKNVILNKLRDKMRNVNDEIKNKLKYEVNTVDSFQGQERDIIIMSCVRSSGIGFLSDKQRLCVALTRAKHALYLCGNFYTFERDHMWNALLTDARIRGVYIDTSYKASIDEIRNHILKH